MECDFCGEEFEGERDLHLHWSKEHADELNSHQEEKVKKAERKQQQEDEKRKKERRKFAGWAFAGVIAIAFLAAVGPQLISSFTASPQQSFDLSEQPMMGSADANVTVVAFEDYKCPHCGDFETRVFPQLKQEYIDSGKVNFYFINFPVTGGQAQNAAVASECVYQQDGDQFWEFHSYLYENQNSFETTTDALVSIARETTEGLNYDELEQCISSRETQAQVESDQKMGRQSGVTGTPSIFLNGKQVQDWNYPNFKSLIEEELAGN